MCAPKNRAPNCEGASRRITGETGKNRSPVASERRKDAQVERVDQPGPQGRGEAEYVTLAMRTCDVQLTFSFPETANVRDRATIQRLNMYNTRPVRSKDGQIISQAYQSKEIPKARIAPNKKWFGTYRPLSTPNRVLSCFAYFALRLTDFSR